MKTLYDSEADALHMRFGDAAILESEEVRPGVIFDFDAEGKIVGIEVLDVSKQMTDGLTATLSNAA